MPVTGQLVFATLITCLSSSFMMGYNLGIINLPSENIKKFMNQTIPNLDLEFAYSLTSVFFIIGAAIGAFSCGFVADEIGRRNGLHLNTVIGLIGSILGGICSFLSNIYVLFIGRFISGLNAGITIGIASMYLLEIAPRNIRGLIGAFHQLFVTIGIFVSYLTTIRHFLNTPERWAYGIMIGGVFHFIGLVLLPFCPESARYLYIIKKDVDRATKEHMRITGADNADEFVSEMNEEAIKVKNEPKFKISYLFTKPEYRKATAIAILIQVLQQLSGINAVIANSSSMFYTAKVDPQYLEYFVVGLGLLNVVTTIIVLPLIEKAGRRALLLWPTLVLAAALLSQTIIVTIVRSLSPEHQPPFAILAVIVVFIYTVCFAIGLGPIPAMIVAEIFRQGPRTAAYSVSQCIQWLCNLLVLATFPSLDKVMAGFVYVPYLVVVLLCWTFFFFVMPETKNKSFDEIARQLEHGSVFSRSDDR
ncbi:unnamed protein product [Rodentolepis nana]|uniref:MFS domain-containing protein n=1 Tax=Rodentolepis nana TaxID=102285 RepID=A0A0R3T6R4_RODNA|nr:unnamed protein product [Rodentolepis nana]